MKYITETLGIAVKCEPWNDFDTLPLFIPDCYEFRKAQLDKVQCLFVKPKSELPAIPALKKHFEIIGERAKMPRVAILNCINARQRKALINAQIPFIVENNHLYLPFMGIALSERFNKPKPISETLMPSAQMLLFHFMYQGGDKLYTNGMAEMLNISKMQVTRAVEQLSALDIVTAHKDGVRIFIEGKETGETLFEKAKPHLLNPVRKRIYIDADELPKGLLLAGETALAEYSMLAGPNMPVCAYFGKVSDLEGTDAPVDSKQVEVEIWQYNPILLSVRDGVADPLSVVTSLLGVDDPRVEMAVEDALDMVWTGGKHG